MPAYKDGPGPNASQAMKAMPGPNASQSFKAMPGPNASQSFRAVPSGSASQVVKEPTPGTVGTTYVGPGEKTSVTQAGEHGEPLEGSCGCGRRTLPDCGFSVAVPAASGGRRRCGCAVAQRMRLRRLAARQSQAIEKAKAAQDEQGKTAVMQRSAPRPRAQASQRATRLLLLWLRPPRVKDS